MPSCAALGKTSLICTVCDLKNILQFLFRKNWSARFRRKSSEWRKNPFHFSSQKVFTRFIKNRKSEKKKFHFSWFASKKNLSPSFKLLWRKKENRAWRISRTTLSATKTMKNNFFIGNESLPRRKKSGTGVLKEKITTVIELGSREQR